VNDDIRFNQARHRADKWHSPTELREYLADSRNTRHRAEAQTFFNRFYDEGRARIQKLNEGKNARGQLADGLLALLEALKQGGTPIITVGFRGQEEPVPVEDELKVLEQAVYQLRLKEEPRLEDVAERSTDKTAILPSGRTFDRDQAARREEVILKQLRASLKKVLATDVLTLERAAPGEPAILEVVYRTKPSGGLYLYTDEGNRAVKGLLRGYTSDWGITLTPPGAGRSWICNLTSNPAGQLKYHSSQDDPHWAPYAIILYSSFEDMAGRLAAECGLEPGQPPQSYTFAEAVGEGKR
jgi:hypothetical protein